MLHTKVKTMLKPSIAITRLSKKIQMMPVSTLIELYATLIWGNFIKLYKIAKVHCLYSQIQVKC